MGRHKKYSGYKAYQYLTPGIDYKAFKLRNAIKTDWAFTIPLSKAEEERVEEIIKKNIVIDLHEHPTLMPKNSQECVEHWSDGREFMAYEALSYSGLDAVFDNMMNGSATITSKHGWKWSDTIFDLGQRLCDIAQQGFVIHCKKVEDIIEAHKTGKLAWVAVLESASSIENEVDRIDVLYGLGIRAMGLNYSESNMLGSGLKELHDGGLTDFGYDSIVRMNKVKMLIDVSHVSDQTALDAIESSKKPIMISHAGARALLPITRLFPDNVLQTLAENEGIIGIEAAPGYTATKNHPSPSIESYMEHLEYCINLMGINHVGCGPDTLYGDHVGFYRLMEERKKIAGLGHYIRPGRVADDSNVENLPKYVKGMENPTECMQNITRWLVKHGYSDQEITKIIGGNALRVLKQVW
ncbi:MAG: dipeptidase [Candidatus Hodarchaeota archaeon]